MGNIVVGGCGVVNNQSRGIKAGSLPKTILQTTPHTLFIVAPTRFMFEKEAGGFGFEIIFMDFGKLC